MSKNKEYKIENFDKKYEVCLHKCMVIEGDIFDCDEY